MTDAIDPLVAAILHDFEHGFAPVAGLHAKAGDLDVAERKAGKHRLFRTLDIDAQQVDPGNGVGRRSVRRQVLGCASTQARRFGS